MTDVVETFDAGGVVEARTTAIVTARILAPVSEVRVAPGDIVRAGQVLVVLAARDLDAHARSASASATAADEGVLAAAADQRAAEAALTLARTSHARIEALFAKRSATAQELDDVTGALRAAEARAAGAMARAQAATAGVASARAASEAANTTASFAVITAPFDGVVTGKPVEPGNMAAPGAPLIRLEDTRGLRLEVRVDESRISEVKLGDSVSVSFDANPGDGMPTVSASLAEISRAVDADARAFLVTLALPVSTRVRSGTFGRATFHGRPRRALTVPADALVHRGQVTSVFVVEDGLAHVRLVNARGTEVLAGLVGGDVVVVAPPASLADGRRVTTGGR
jgi:RND family efflux transporter MFP subunit